MPKFYGQIKGFKFDNVQPTIKEEPSHHLASTFPRRASENSTAYLHRLDVIEELMNDPDSPRHGTPTAHNSGWRCTCEKCKDVREKKYAITREYNRARRRREKI